MRLPPWVWLVLALGACKDDPKPFTAAGYTFMVAGWDPTVSKTGNSQMVKFEAFAEDSVCMIQVLALKEVAAEDYENELLTEFKAKSPAAVTVDTPLGPFEGHGYSGVLPSEGFTGAVAQLAGPPHIETLVRRDGDQLLAMMLMRFGDDGKGVRSLARCKKMLATVARAK